MLSPRGVSMQTRTFVIGTQQTSNQVLSEQSGHGHCNCERSANDPQWTIRPCQALLRADQTMHASCGLCPRVLATLTNQTRRQRHPQGRPDTPDERATREAEATPDEGAPEREVILTKGRRWSKSIRLFACPLLAQSGHR
jgi:hypothetical protein